MGAVKKQDEVKAFRDSWADTLALLKAVGEGSALDFGDKLAIALDAVGAGLSILSGMDLIDSLAITLSGWENNGRAAVVRYSLVRELNECEEREYIRKETILKESI